MNAVQRAKQGVSQSLTNTVNLLKNSTSYTAKAGIIDSMSNDDKIMLAALYWLGRSPWERNYYETEEYQHFIEDYQSQGLGNPSQQELDDKFLSNDDKKQQVIYDIEHAMQEVPNMHSEYLAGKMELVGDFHKGILMLNEVTF